MEQAARDKFGYEAKAFWQSVGFGKTSRVLRALRPHIPAASGGYVERFAFGVGHRRADENFKKLFLRAHHSHHAHIKRSKVRVFIVACVSNLADEAALRLDISLSSCLDEVDDGQYSFAEFAMPYQVRDLDDKRH